jgi:Lon protease-like protein
MGEVIERFPLFPLGLVLLPTESVPLHIFEERYKLMIGECLDEEREFGILWVSDDGLRETGCAARITRLLERLPDGRMNIVVEGTAPFMLRRRVEDLPNPAGDVELLDEEAVAEDPVAGDEARDRYADLVERATDERPAAEELAELGAYAMAATLDVAPEAKQELLELRSETGRLERLAELCEGAMDDVERAREVAERARSNGKGFP